VDIGGEDPRLLAGQVDDARSPLGGRQRDRVAGSAQSRAEGQVRLDIAPSSNGQDADLHERGIASS
jgi:hypothetical protein